MDGFMWLIISWLAVGAFCYFVLKTFAAPNQYNLEPHPAVDASLLQKTTISDVHGAAARAQGKEASADSRSETDIWLNEFIAWMFSNFRGPPEAANAWIRSLNEAANKVTTTNCEVLFEGFGDHTSVREPPTLRNIRVQRGPRDHLTFRIEIFVPVVHLKLVSSQRLHDRLLVTNYDAALINLSGEVQTRIACIANELFLMGCFNGRPNMDIRLIDVDAKSGKSVHAGLVDETIRRCLVSAVTNVTLTGARDRMDSANRNISPQIAPRLPVDQILRQMPSAQKSQPLIPAEKEPNKVRVTVVRAQKLGGDRSDVHQPYVVIEMDDPPKKCATSKGINVSPYWEETFEFQVTPASEEILFEVYEGAKDQPSRFLGLAIIGFQEIIRSKQNVHCLPLQTRPYRNDNVSGNITVQFEFLHDSNPIITTTEKSEESVVAGKRERPPYDPYDTLNGYLAADSQQQQNTRDPFLKSVSQQSKSEQQNIDYSRPGEELKSRDILQKRVQIVEKGENDTKKATESRLCTILRPARELPHVEWSGAKPTESVQYQSAHSVQQEPKRHQQKQAAVGLDSSREQTSLSVGATADTDRGRQRERGESRSFFGQMKHRLSGRRMQRRTHSLDVHEQQKQETCVLADKRSLSQTSSIRGSNRSIYQHSTLVIQLSPQKQSSRHNLNNHNNHPASNRYYLIPSHVINEPAATKLMRRGTKLHIFNEHTFSAVKVPRDTECQVCERRIGRSFSKQAYQCRDCQLLCHKTCHYKTDTFCNCSNVSSMKIISDVDWEHFLSHFNMEEYISAAGI